MADDLKRTFADELEYIGENPAMFTKAEISAKLIQAAVHIRRFEDAMPALKEAAFDALEHLERASKVVSFKPKQG